MLLLQETLHIDFFLSSFHELINILLQLHIVENLSLEFMEAQFIHEVNRGKIVSYILKLWLRSIRLNYHLCHKFLQQPLEEA